MSSNTPIDGRLKPIGQVEDELTAKVATLSANLHCTYGKASEAFSCLGDYLRESLLSGCSRLVDKIKVHLENLTTTPSRASRHVLVFWNGCDCDFRDTCDSLTLFINIIVYNLV